jgi:hypothetical protein
VPKWWIELMPWRWQQELRSRLLPILLPETKRVQRSYKTKEDAKLALDAHLEEKRLGTIEAKNKRVPIFDLTDMQHRNVMRALDILPPGRSLTEAVQFFVEHVSPEGGQRTVEELLGDYLANKDGPWASPRR